MCAVRVCRSLGEKRVLELSHIIHKNTYSCHSQCWWAPRRAAQRTPPLCFRETDHPVRLPPAQIAVEGCAHGELDSIYASLALAEQRCGAKVDVLLYYHCYHDCCRCYHNCYTMPFFTNNAIQYVKKYTKLKISPIDSHVWK